MLKTIVIGKRARNTATFAVLMTDAERRDAACEKRIIGHGGRGRGISLSHNVGVAYLAYRDHRYGVEQSTTV